MPITEEQEPSEWVARRDVFLKEYKDLIDKHFVDFVSYPIFVPNKDGVFQVMMQTQVIDKHSLGVPSDIIVK